MKLSRFIAVASAVAFIAFPALAQVRIGVISSATGAVAAVGIPQKNTVPLLPTRIGDLDVEYTFFDDASDVTQTVTIARRLISENKVDAIIGPSGSPHAVALIQYVAESATPLLAPVGTVAVVLPMDDKKRWVFKTTQNDRIIANALFGHMKRHGVKTLGFIGFSDSYGETWHQEAIAQAKAAGIQVVADERFARTDSSVTGQTVKLIAARPDAILVAGAGSGTVLPQVSLYDAGYKGQIYQTHGAATPDLIRLGGNKVEGTVLCGSLMLVLPEIADSVPSKKVALEYIDAYRKLYGAAPATFGANVYDAGLLLKDAIPKAAAKAKPGTPEFRAALRDAIEQTHELVATQGVYNLSPQDHSGFDDRGRVLVTVKDGAFRLLKD